MGLGETGGQCTSGKEQMSFIWTYAVTSAYLTNPRKQN